jgi:hypothetical protein
LQGEPLLTPTLLRLVGEPHVVDDTKARRELGYTAHFTPAEGFAEMAAAVTAHVDATT